MLWLLLSITMTAVSLPTAPDGCLPPGGVKRCMVAIAWPNTPVLSGTVAMD